MVNIDGILFAQSLQNASGTDEKGETANCRGVWSE